MEEVQERGLPRCLLFCGAGCLVCLGDGPVIMADMASGGSVWQISMSS